MMNPFGCATFHHDDYEDDELCLASPNYKPKRKDKDTNPYSTRGLDKFSALLADLDERRQRIYSQMKPHDISFVRFAYSSTDDFVPIVVKKVKKKNNNNKDHQKKKQQHKSQEQLKAVKVKPSLTNSTIEEEKHSSTIIESSSEALEDLRNNANVAATKTKNWDILKSMYLDTDWNPKNWGMWMRPSFYVPMVIVLILVLLTFFGRTVTTLCTCVLWYVVPTLKDNMSSSSTTSSNSSRKNMMKKKKDYVRGFSEKKMVVMNEGVKKKDYVRGFSEKKIKVVSNEGVKKKKDYLRGWSDKIVTDYCLLNSPTSGGGGDFDDASSKNKSSGSKHGHKNSW